MALPTPPFTGPPVVALQQSPLNPARKRGRESDIDEKIVKRAIHFFPLAPPQSLPTLPQLQIMPPTPQKPRTPLRSGTATPKKEKENSFPNPLITFLDFAITAIVPSSIELKYAYESNNRIHTLITQLGSKSCGATAFLMLYTDLVRAGLPWELSQSFWDSYGASYLDDVVTCSARADLTNMKKNGYTLIGESLNKDPEANLIRLRKLLEESGFPIILSITHPTLAGHWIVLDDMNDTHNNIRDPSSGKAFSVPFATMLTYFDEEIGENCLYIKK